MANSFAIGTTRSLTAQFIKLRNDSRRAMGITGTAQDKATASLVKAALQEGANGDEESQHLTPASEALALPWIQKAEKIKAEMNIVKDRMSKLREAHGRALLVSFNTDDDGTAHVDALTRDIQSTFKRIEAEIKSIDQGPGSQEDVATRKTIQRSLAQALTRLTGEFRKEQTRFLNKVEAQKDRKVGGTLGIVESESQMNLAEQDLGFTQSQLALVDVSAALAEERDREIRKIVQTIVELTQIMTDMHELVVQQGSILDRIDRNIEAVAVSVEKGVKELESAEKTQKMSRMMMCIIALVVVIVLLFIIVLVRHA